MSLISGILIILSLFLALFLLITTVFLPLAVDVHQIIKEIQMELTRGLRDIEDFTQKECGSLVLSPDQDYLFKSNSIGHFRIRGGLTGNITVDGRVVTIWDDQKHVLFQCGYSTGRVEIKDSPENGGSTVQLIHNGAKFQSNFAKNQNKLIFAHKGIKVNVREYSSDDRENPGELQIVGYPNEDIIIAGHRPVVITGNGGYLKKMGTNKVTVRGNLQKVAQEGTSTIKVHGNVTGDVSDVGIGSINIDGDVWGSVTLDCSEALGSIIIKGNVHGDIRCKGFGSVEVLGSHLNGGKIITEEFGHVSIDGDGTTSFLSKFLRFL